MMDRKLLQSISLVHQSKGMTSFTDLHAFVSVKPIEKAVEGSVSELKLILLTPSSDEWSELFPECSTWDGRAEEYLTHSLFCRRHRRHLSSATVGDLSHRVLEILHSTQADPRPNWHHCLFQVRYALEFMISSGRWNPNFPLQRAVGSTLGKPGYVEN